MNIRTNDQPNIGVHSQALIVRNRSNNLKMHAFVILCSDIWLILCRTRPCSVYSSVRYTTQKPVLPHYKMHICTNLLSYLNTYFIMMHSFCIRILSFWCIVAIRFPTCESSSYFFFLLEIVLFSQIRCKWSGFTMYEKIKIYNLKHMMNVRDYIHTYT